jgi:electron transfer flavoprotein alpha subunit
MATRTILNSAAPPAVLVFVDLAGGELDDAGKGILSEAARLAKVLGGSWSALAFANSEKPPLNDFAPYGTPALTLIEAGPEVADSLEAQGRLIAAAAAASGARLLLLAHNDLGASLAPLLAAEIEGALFTEALAYQRDGAVLNLSRALLGTQVVETKSWENQVALVLTIHPRILSTVVLPSMQRSVPVVSSWRSSQPVLPDRPGSSNGFRRIHRPSTLLTRKSSSAPVSAVTKRVSPRSRS